MNKDSLHEYQVTCTKHIFKHTHSGLFLDMGLGKTVITLTAIDELMYSDLSINSALIIGPKRVVENVWHTEIKKWAHLKHLTCSIVAGSAKKRREALQQKADIYLVSRDNIAWLCGQYGGSMLPFDMLVIDESSSFKNHKSIRFKALRNVQMSFKRVVILTGTPAPNGLIDLWSQIYLLDRGKRLGKFISHYRNEYFNPGRTNGAIVYNYNLQRDADKRIHNQIKDICISMTAKDYLEMPERIENVIPVVFDEATQKKYNDFEREQVLELFSDIEDGKEISAVNAAALSNKLLQFANGAVYDEDRNVHEVHNLKIDAVKEIVEETGGKPILIGWTYRHDRDRLMNALKKYKPRELKTGQDIDDWNNKKIQIMMMHPASGGHGLNLQGGGNTIIWFGQTWSLELYMQFNARLFRQGQTNAVIIHKLIAHNTIDQDVVKAQGRKLKKQDALIDAVKARIRKYLDQNQ